MLDIILIVLFFQLVTLLPFLFSAKTGRVLSNRILGVFLLAKALCITNFLSFRLWDYTMAYFPHAFYFGTSFAILWGPALLLYVRSLIASDFRFRFSDGVQFLPFLVHFVLIFVTFHVFSADTKREIMKSGGLFTETFWIYFFCVLHLYTLAYILAAMNRIRIFRSDIKKSNSETDQINISWMYLILTGFMAKISADMIYNLVQKPGMAADISLIISRASLFIFVNIMLYKGLRYPMVFLGLPKSSALKKSSLSKASQDTYLRKLLSCMESEKPFLNPDLTFEDLSRMASIPPRSLTLVLNERLNQNFYDFVNSFRVKESVQLLASFTSQDKSVLEVLFEVGFSSKSSFNAAFKKFTGMTPTEYRNFPLQHSSADTVPIVDIVPPLKNRCG